MPSNTNEDDITTYRLPTLDALNAIVPVDINAQDVMTHWFSAFAQNIEQQNIDGIISLFHPSASHTFAFWRDFLSLTWDFRLFAGHASISEFLLDQLPKFSPRQFKLRHATISVQRPYDDLAWITAMFDFETNVGICSGVARLIPTEGEGEWKAHVVFTNLEDLHGVREKAGLLRNHEPNHGLWKKQRKEEAEFRDKQPAVVIIGAGHSGLTAAVRLKALGVSVLIVEKNERVGDNWRNRYDALCLHDPIWFDHMPYMPFPSTWPVYTPARKFAGWLENYAETMELPVWTSSAVTRAIQDDSNNKWTLTIRNSKDGSERELITSHLVFATGMGGGIAKEVDYPGLKDKFKGQYMHSTQHKRALDHVGKRVVVVGTGTSAHDIARDYCENGIDVTMVQRSPTYVMSTDPGWEFLFKGTYWEGGPPADLLDRLRSTFPRVVALELIQRQTKALAKLDANLLNGLRKVGFKLSLGDRDAGFQWSAFSRAGGYYIDVGASQLIIDGKIKLKSDSTISEINETGLVFADGSYLQADVIVFATGVGDPRDAIRRVCGDGVGDRLKPIWSIDKEGEIGSVWRSSGVKNLWYAFGNLGLCRLHSKHLALQIKAIEDGVYGECYSTPVVVA